VPANGYILDFEVTRDSRTVLAYGSIGGSGDLRHMPIDGSQSSSSVSGLLAGTISAFAPSPRGTEAIYIIDSLTAGMEDLYIAPMDASTAPQLLTPDTILEGTSVPSGWRAASPGSTVPFADADRDRRGSPWGMNEYDVVNTISQVRDANGNLTFDGTRVNAFGSLNRLVRGTRISDGQVIANYAYESYGRADPADRDHGRFGDR